MILIFAGAGASKAVNSERYPTTVDFFNQLPSDTLNNPLFVQCIEFLRRNNRETIDIEDVLWILHELGAFINQAVNQSSVPGWFLQGYRFQRALNIEPRKNFEDFLSLSAQMSGAVSHLIQSINIQVYERYSREPEEEELDHTWLPLLARLLLAGVRIELFTTNYDPILETAAEYLRARSIEPYISNGSIGKVWRYLDLSVWPKSLEELPSGGGLITKLHGSLDWSRNQDNQNRILLSDPYFKGDNSRHIIIYPGFKGVPVEEPLVTFYNYFGATVPRAKVLIFIGFAFRDEYINDILKRNTSPDAEIYVLNPQKQLITPYPKKRVKHIADYFNIETAQHLTLAALKAWRRQ